MSRIHTRGYVPDGEDAYTSAIPWWQLPLALLGLTALCLPTAFGTAVPASTVAVTAGVAAVALTVLWLRRADQAGVHFAIDRRGVYRGASPGAGLVPWARITHVSLALEGDYPWAADALRLRVRFIDLDSVVAGERVIVIGKDEAAIARAITRYAPIHVQLTGTLGRQRPAANP